MLRIWEILTYNVQFHMRNGGWRSVKICSTPIFARVTPLDVVYDQPRRTEVAAKKCPASEDLLFGPVPGLSMGLPSCIVPEYVNKDVRCKFVIACFLHP